MRTQHIYDSLTRGFSASAAGAGGGGEGGGVARRAKAANRTDGRRDRTEPDGDLGALEGREGEV